MKPMRYQVLLPSVISDARLDWVLKMFARLTEKEPRHTRVVLDWQRVKAVSPAGCAILAMVDDWLTEHAYAGKSIHLRTSIKPYAALVDFQRHRQDGALPSPNIHNLETTEVLLHGCATGIDMLFLERFFSKFASRISEDLFFDCKLVLQELMQNTVDHSTAERYHVYAGFFGSEFHVGCLDLGVTIPAKLAQKYRAETDRAFLELAMKKGVTTRRRRTGGLGLYYFFDFLKRNHGKLTIMSGRGHLRRYFKTRRAQRSDVVWPLPGTWCFARFACTRDDP